MPDLDEFEPTARQWKSVLDDFASDNSKTSDEIADKTLEQVTRMLYVWKGCLLLPRIVDLLWSHQSLSPQDDAQQDVIVTIHSQLDRWAMTAPDERISMVAIRSAKSVSLQLYDGHAHAEDKFALHHLLAAEIVKDLLRHCCLDRSRALAVGKRFQTGLEAHQFASQIVNSLENGIREIATSLMNAPDGSSLYSHSMRSTREKMKIA